MPQVIDEFEERLRQSLERVIAFELRVERLPTVFVVRLFLPHPSLIFFPDLVVRSLLLALRVELAAKNFVLKKLQLASNYLDSQKIVHFSFCHAMA